MGGIRDQFGPIAIESRRESFIVHASYGLREARAQIQSMMPGEYFRYPIDNELGRDPWKVYKVHSIDEHWVYSSDERKGGDDTHRRNDTEIILCDREGRALDEEEDEDSGVFGKRWRSYPHPEFRLEDLPNLIAALRDLEANSR